MLYDKHIYCFYVLLLIRFNFTVMSNEIVGKPVMASVLNFLSWFCTLNFYFQKANSLCSSYKNNILPGIIDAF